MSDETHEAARNMDVLRLAFAEWLCDPNRPGTEAAWAAEHDVNPATLWRWKKHPEVRAIVEKWQAEFRPAMAEVAFAMLKKAKQGDVQAARLLGDWLGMNAPQKVDVTGRMTMADFLSKASFAELPAPDARLS